MQRWKIAVYARDHGVPHFHVEGPDFRCSISIADLDVIVGKAPPVVFRDAIEWAIAIKQVLVETWQELNG